MKLIRKSRKTLHAVNRLAVNGLAVVAVGGLVAGTLVGCGDRIMDTGFSWEYFRKPQETDTSYPDQMTLEQPASWPEFPRVIPQRDEYTSYWLGRLHSANQLGHRAAAELQLHIQDRRAERASSGTNLPATASTIEPWESPLLEP